MVFSVPSAPTTGFNIHYRTRNIQCPSAAHSSLSLDIGYSLLAVGHSDISTIFITHCSPTLWSTGMNGPGLWPSRAYRSTPGPCQIHNAARSRHILCPARLTEDGSPYLFKAHSTAYGVGPACNARPTGSHGTVARSRHPAAPPAASLPLMPSSPDQPTPASPHSPGHLATFPPPQGRARASHLRASLASTGRPSRKLTLWVAGAGSPGGHQGGSGA